MAKSINWDRRRFDGRRTLNIKDEAEFRKGDTTARWLAEAQAKKAKQQHHAHAKQQHHARDDARVTEPKPGGGGPRKPHWKDKLDPGEAPF